MDVHATFPKLLKPLKQHFLKIYAYANIMLECEINRVVFILLLYLILLTKKNYSSH
jgi:hypothetical protein